VAKYSGTAQTFSVSASGVLTVQGDQQASPNDTITLDRVGNRIQVTLDGEVVQFDAGVITAIVVNDGAGTDAINVESTFASAPVTVNLGSGNDYVNISPSAGNLGNIQGPVTINGGPGYDTSNLFDTNDTSPTTYTLTASAVVRTGSAAITSNRMRGVALVGGSGGDVFSCRAPLPPTRRSPRGAAPTP
jgi:hypothetical protein